MAFAHTAQERAEFNAKAGALLAQYPDVGAFIRGAHRDPEAPALVSSTPERLVVVSRQARA